MPDLRELYQDVIFDHNRRPRNFGPMPEASRRAEGFNPLCGDRLTLYLKLDDGKIADVRFEGSGCAISTASASLMTESLKGKTEAEAEALFRDMHALITEGSHAPDSLPPKLRALEKMSEFPARVKCATLCWHTLRAALANEDQPVSTE